MLVAEAEQLVSGDHLVESTLGCLFLDPFKKARYGRAVTRLRRFMPGHFDRVLDCLGQHRRVPTTKDARAAFVERLGDCGDRTLRIDRDQLAVQRPQIRLELITLVQPDAIAEMRSYIVADLF